MQYKTSLFISYFKKFNKLSSYPLSDFLSGCFFNENNLEEILIIDIIINFLFTYFRHLEYNFQNSNQRFTDSFSSQIDRDNMLQFQASVVIN